MEPAPFIIWGLLDDRPGTGNQIRGVVQCLNRPYILKKIAYTKHASLPFFLWGNSLKGLDIAQSDSISPPYPDMIIAAGRRSAVIADFIKKQHPTCKWVQLMWPGIIFYHADLIILPSHDAPHLFLRWFFAKICRKKFSVAPILGTPHPFPVSSFPPQSDSLKKIGICIGGGFGEKLLQDFVSTLNAVTKNTESDIFITTSRRTPEYVLPYLKEKLSQPFTSYDWHQKKGIANPYRTLLEESDSLIITGDSISMCSEACASGKAVYIYASPGFCSKKHQRFHKALIEKNYARMLQKEETLSLWNPTPLDATQAIIDIIKEQNFL